MTSAAAIQLPSLESFLEWERLQDERYELIDGLVRAMTGGTLKHNIIVQNFVVYLRSVTSEGPCQVFSENVKVIVDGAVMYPDVVVTCCTPSNLNADFVSDPVLVIEVLSRSTHEIDRGRKWLAYQQIESLRQYVLVSQDEPRVEMYRRSDEGWSYIVITGIMAAVTLEPANTAIPLAVIYERTSVADS